MLKIIRDMGHWHVRGTFMGERVRRTTGLKSTKQFKPMAEKMRVKIERDIADNSFGKHRVSETWGDAAREYMLWKQVEGNLPKRTVAKLEMMSEYWEDIPLTEVDNGTVTAYIQSHWTRLSASSVKRYLNDFIAVLSHADGRIKGFNAPKIKRPYANDIRTVHLEQDEASELLDWFKENRPAFWPHFVAMVDTGVRISELVALQPRSFSHNKQVTMVRKSHDTARTKTQARDIPMTDDMLEVARRTQGMEVNLPVFRGITGVWHSPNSASGALNTELKAACRELGFPYQGEEAIRCHDLRHTFAYLCASNGADLGDLQYLLGHSDISMTMRYRGFIQSRARNAVANMRTVSAA